MLASTPVKNWSVLFGAKYYCRMPFLMATSTVNWIREKTLESTVYHNNIIDDAQMQNLLITPKLLASLVI